jgi:hypothetical protein
MRMLSEQGVIGFSLFAVVLLAALRSGWRLYRKAQTSYLRGLGLGFMGCVVAVLVTNMFGDRWSYFVLGGYFFVVWGLVDRGIRIATESPVAVEDRTAKPGWADAPPALAPRKGASETGFASRRT